MADTRTGIGLQVRLSGKEQARKELNDIIKYLEGNSKVSLKFDSKGMTQSLNEFSKALDGISSKMNGAFKSEGAKKTTTEIKNATKANKESIESFVRILERDVENCIIEGKFFYETKFLPESLDRKNLVEKYRNLDFVIQETKQLAKQVCMYGKNPETVKTDVIS